jgi:hypothetical protein
VLARRLLRKDAATVDQPCQKIAPNSSFSKHLSSTNQLSTLPTHHDIITMEYENDQRGYDGLSLLV